MDEYKGRYTSLNIQQSGPIEIGKYLLIYYFSPSMLTG